MICATNKRTNPHYLVTMINLTIRNNEKPNYAENGAYALLYQKLQDSTIQTVTAQTWIQPLNINGMASFYSNTERKIHKQHKIEQCYSRLQ